MKKINKFLLLVILLLLFLSNCQKKKIQSEIIRILEEIKEKKYNFNTSEVSIDKKMYFLVVGEYQKELKLLNEIISDIENNNYEKVNENNFILKRQNLEIGDTIIKLTIKEEK